MQRLIQTLALTAIIAAFIAPGAGFVMNVMTETDGISVTEKRRLAELPRFAGDARAYTTELDAYLEDHFGFRMALIRLARKVRDNVGENPNEVVYGRNGWLFLGQNAYRDEYEGNGVWDTQQVDTWIESFSEVKAKLARQDIPFAAFIAIDKARAYPEYLPDGWTASPRRFRSAVHAHPDVGQTGLMDAEPIVMAAKARGEQVFFLRDTHWTTAGTYDLAMRTLDMLDPQQARPRYQPGPPVLQQIPRNPDLDGLAGFAASQEPPVTMIKFPPLRSGYRQLLHKRADGTAPRGEMATLKILGTEDAPPGRLVIVGDSFGDAMIGHFRPSYAEIIRIHHGAHFFDIDLGEVLSYQPDAVLFVTAERQAFRKARPFLPLDETTG